MGFHSAKTMLWAALKGLAERLGKKGPKWLGERGPMRTKVTVGQRGQRIR